MKPTFKLLALFILAGGLLTSCVSSKKYNELLAERDQLSQSLSQTQEMLKQLEAEKAELEGKVDDLTEKYNQEAMMTKSLKDQLNDLEAKVNKLDAEFARVKGEVKSAFEVFDTPGLEIRQEGDMFYASMDEKLLFRSGSNYINKTGREILKSFSDVMKNNAEIAIMVEGHTDDVPINTEKFSDNWDLSVGRATAVVKYLAKEGVDQGRMVAAGRSKYDPAVTDNPKSAETRKMNRRVEIAIFPNVGSLYKMMEE